MTGRLADSFYSGLRFPTNPNITSGGRTNHPLSTAYVHGTSGNGFAVRYQARSTDPINELYVLLDAATGTLANITMGCVLYNEHASSATQPGSTARATATAVTMPSAITKWIRIVFGTPYTPAIGETLWFVLRNTSAAPTVDFPNILCTFNSSPAFSSLLANHSGYSTVNGFSSAGTIQARPPFVVVQGTKSFGWSQTILNAAVIASSTAMKGFQITPPVDIEVSGWQTAIPNTLMTGVRIYNSTVPPAGSALYTFPLGTDTNQSRDELIGAKFWPAVILSGGTTYNVVTSWASASAIGGATIEDYASFPAVFDNLVDGFVNCWPVADVAGVWTLTKSSFVNQQLIVSDIIAPALTVRRPKVWNGSVWQEKPMGVWNGSVWEEQPLKIWNGSAWV